MTKTLLLACTLSLAGPAGAYAAEAGWKVLFDGTSTDAWRGFRRDTFPSKGWVIENGALKTVVGGDRCDIISRDRYKDFELELEWRVSPGGNSGVFYDVAETDTEAYFTGPEIQVIDDAGHADAKNPKRTAGSLYDLIVPAAKAKPAGEYNHFRIVKKAGRVEHWLNGAKAVEYQLGSPELTKMIAESKFKDMQRFAKEGQGYVSIQHHGQEVWFKNVRIKALSPVIVGDPVAPRNVLTAAEQKAGWKLLFDGKTPAGWRGFKKTEFPKEGWVVKDGAIVKLARGTGDSRGAGDIVSVDTFDDFDLRFEWKVVSGANSGVKYLVTEERSGPIAHEYQIIDDDKHPDAQIGGHRQTAALYDAFPAKDKVLQPVGEFNQSRILVRGKKVEHWLNGRRVLSYELDSDELKAAKAKSKFKDEAGWGTKLKGHILLQDHGDEVAFRNIKILAIAPE